MKIRAALLILITIVMVAGFGHGQGALNCSGGIFGCVTGISTDGTKITALGVNTSQGAAGSIVATGNIAAGAGNFIFFSTRSQISSPADSQLLIQNAAGTTFARLQFGGTTASFPSLKLNGTGIDCRLADDSAACGLFTAGALQATTLKDANGNPFLLSSATASAVDGVTITNAATATVATVTIGASGTDTNVTTQVSGKGTGLVSWGSIEQSPSNIVRLDNAFTDANASGLQNITGLSWTMPANIAVIWPFHCRLVVNQNTAAVVDTIGIQDITVAPTYIQATGVAETALTTAAFGDLGTGLASTTATGIISFTPAAIGTNLTVLIDGLINQPSNASSSVIQMMIQQATSADTIIVQKGSFCSFGGTS